MEAQDSSKVLVKVRVLNGVLNVELDEVVKSPHFQCGDYGFNSLIVCNLYINRSPDLKS